MISNGLKVCAASLFLGGLLSACLPEEDSGECSSASACPQRGQVCNLQTHTCELADVDVDATADKAEASFSNVPVPFFRGKVCVGTKVKPGETVPVKVSTCLHPCLTAGGYAFKKQYTCTGSSCDSLVLVYYPKVSGAGCPVDAFGGFDRSQCVYDERAVSAGPYNITSGPVSGTAKVEVPFLRNDDIATLLPLENQADARVAKAWELTKQYPIDSDRVFSVSINAGNPSAPKDCADESACECREIGF